MCHKVISPVHCSAPIGISDLWIILYSLQIYWGTSLSREKLRARKLLSVMPECSKTIWTWHVLLRLSKICSAQALSKNRKTLVCHISQINNFLRLNRLARKLLSGTLECSKTICTWRVLLRLSKIYSAQALSKNRKTLVCYNSQINNFLRLKRLNSRKEVQE